MSYKQELHRKRMDGTYLSITFGLPSPSHENDALRMEMAFWSEAEKVQP